VIFIRGSCYAVHVPRFTVIIMLQRCHCSSNHCSHDFLCTYDFVAVCCLWLSLPVNISLTETYPAVISFDSVFNCSDDDDYYDYYYDANKGGTIMQGCDFLENLEVGNLEMVKESQGENKM